MRWVLKAAPFSLAALGGILEHRYVPEGGEITIFQDLISGLPKRSRMFEEGTWLWQLGMRIKRSDPLRALFHAHSDPVLSAALEASDDGRDFLAQYRGFLRDFDHRGHADRDMEAIAHLLMGSLKAEVFLFDLNYTHRLLVLRDAERWVYDCFTLARKHTVAELGRRLGERGLLAAPRDHVEDWPLPIIVLDTQPGHEGGTLCADVWPGWQRRPTDQPSSPCITHRFAAALALWMRSISTMQRRSRRSPRAIATSSACCAGMSIAPYRHASPALSPRQIRVPRSRSRLLCVLPRKRLISSSRRASNSMGGP